jgi:hypothetical protein
MSPLSLHLIVMGLIEKKLVLTRYIKYFLSFKLYSEFKVKAVSMYVL